ncbi:NAD(P)/FAD-dependent oxidoreductase [Rhodocaloribacter sp.]
MGEFDADVAVLGSGFGGSLCALILDRLGLRVALLDRAAHPRFAIGESSTPVADMILRDLALRYDLPRLLPLWKYGSWRETYPDLVNGLKRGFSYFHHRPGEDFAPRADHANELLVAASREDALSDTHWLRAGVDAFFAGEVRRAGIPFFENTEVALRADGRGWRLEGQREGAPVRGRAAFVLDATGAAGAVAEALGIVDEGAGLHTHSRALFAHFTGVRRWGAMMAARGGSLADHPYPCDAAALHHVLDGAWMWVLRFGNDLVSAGLVLDARRHPLDPALAPEDEWARWLRRYPALAEQFADARLTDPPGRFIRTGRLQRRRARAVGARWAALPHAAGFVDPLHSAGIALTLGGVERLMRTFERHWGRSSFGPALEACERAVFTELALIDGLVAACYAAMPDFRRFTASTMLYFAATIAYEQARARGEAGERYLFCADDRRLHAVVAEARARLAGIGAGEAATAAYERFVEDAIKPYNTAGLFHPPAPNMYHHTAAPMPDGLRS